MELIDTHCHLEAQAFAGDLPAVAAHAAAQGVTAMVSVGVSPADFPAQRAAMAVARSEGLRVAAAYGSHPWWVDRVSPSEAVDALDQVHAANGANLMAVGEIGLDFAGKAGDTDRQNALFVAQLEWAGHHGLPVILHERKSADRLLYWLRRRQHAGGVVHGFTGSLQQARQFIDQGLYLGVGGAITHPGAHRMHRMMRELPLDALVLETDAPNQPGHAHRDERNLPGYLPENLAALARLRDMEEGALLERINRNVHRLFGDF
ncbi:TatD family hydrolase [Guyparkeria sp. 1SP6A2]|nr:TatD family hydrolase [Guyparkeria sp. 1SP6A2]